MKCHICDQELIPDNFAFWHVGSRKMIVNRCNNTNCLSHKEAHCAPTLCIIFPDNFIEDYALPIKIQDQWYRFYGNHRNGTTSLYGPKAESALELKRFYPINFNMSLVDQLSVITDKLKTLLLFS